MYIHKSTLYIIIMKTNSRSKHSDWTIYFEKILLSIPPIHQYSCHVLSSTVNPSIFIDLSFLQQKQKLMEHQPQLANRQYPQQPQQHIYQPHHPHHQQQQQHQYQQQSYQSPSYSQSQYQSPQQQQQAFRKPTFSATNNFNQNHHQSNPSWRTY